MKNVLAAAAILASVAAPAFAQTVNGTSTTQQAPAVLDQKEVFDKQNVAPGVDPQSTQTVIPADPAIAPTDPGLVGEPNTQGDGAPLAEETEENGERAVGGRAN